MPPDRRSTWIRIIMLVVLFKAMRLCSQHTIDSRLHFTVADGLPSNSMHGMRQDTKGYIWLRSPRGIAKFDGYEFRQFTIQDGLPNNNIWGFSFDKQDRVWLHTYSPTLTYIKNDSVHSLSTITEQYIVMKEVR